MRKITALGLGACLPLLMANDDCSGDQGQKVERDAVKQQDLQYARNQPPPTFDWSLERHIMSKVYQARNSAVSTWTYVLSEYTGKLLWSCPSLGFPIPYSAQLTNPSKMAWEGYHDSAVIPQAEPNGLYPPPSAEATVVPCIDPTGKVTPAYVEPRVMTFFQPMQPGPDGGLVPLIGAKPTLTIDTKRPS
jgi:hypothetical protein